MPNTEGMMLLDAGFWILDLYKVISTVFASIEHRPSSIRF